MPEVAIGEVNGTKIRRHQLDLEARTLAHVCRRLGQRLRGWLIDTEPADGSTGPLPDEDWTRNAYWYSNAVLGLLKEQRERAKLAGEKPIMTDEEFAAEEAKIRAEIRESLSMDELEAMLAQRKAQAVIGEDGER